MKKMLSSKKLNNRGMSLVEVVVAIAILSIVVVAVLHSFVYSARFNARSRERQQTTAAAQTVMENFKAYSTQEIYDKCQAGSFVLSGGIGEVKYGSPSGGDMEFVIAGMNYQNKLYDVKVNLTSHNSLAANVDTLLYSNPTQEHAVAYVGDAGMDGKALQGIMKKVAEEWTRRESTALSGGSATPAPGATSAPTALHSADEVDSSKIHITKRELTVDIKKAGSSGNYVAEVSCVYSYNVTDYPYMTDTHGGVGQFSLTDQSYQADLSDSTEEGHSLSKEIYNQSTSLDCLNLYYYPAYSYVPGASGSGVPDADSPVRIAEDHIYINNQTDNDVKCYIYKQKNLAISDAKLSTSENVYKVNLHLKNAYVYNDNLNTVLGNDEGSLTDSKIAVSVTGRGVADIMESDMWRPIPMILILALQLCLCQLTCLWRR